MIYSTPFPPRDGIGNHVFSISKILVERGHEVLLVTRGSSPTGSRTEEENFQVIKTPFLPLYPFHISLQKLLFKKDYKKIMGQSDIVHYHTPLVPSFGPSANGVTTFHSSPVQEANGMENDLFLRKYLSKYYSRVFSSKYCRDLVKSSRSIIAVSDSLRKDIQSEFGVDNRIEVIQQGRHRSFQIQGI